MDWIIDTFRKSTRRILIYGFLDRPDKFLGKAPLASIPDLKTNTFVFGWAYAKKQHILFVPRNLSKSTTIYESKSYQEGSKPKGFADISYKYNI